MSVVKYYLTAMIKNWKKTIKLILQSIRSRTVEWSEISVDDLYDRLNSNRPPLLIDVRSAEEFNSGYGHIPNAILIPILKLKSSFEELESYKESEIVTMCPGGGLSLVAVDILNEAGFKDVKSLQGGTDLWYKKGYPTTIS